MSLRPIRHATLPALALLLLPHIAGAQTPPVVVQDLLADVAIVEEKILGLAEAIPENAYAWRPGPGVRSVSETLVHVAADNWLLPAFAGHTPPAETGISADSYPSVQAYEGRAMSRAEAIAAVRASFAYLRNAMTATTEAQLTEEVTLFRTPMTVRRLWITATTHLHEHLGQLIAYARSNDVVPPWSR